MRPFLAGSQDNASGLDIGIERITSTDAEPAAERSRKNYLAFG
jgi:hypothetical protein